MKKFAFSTLLLLLSFIVLSLPYTVRTNTVEPSKSDNLILKKRTAAVKPASQKISGNAEISRVIVKFKENSGVRLRSDKLVSNRGLSLKSANDIVEPYTSGRLSPLLPISEEKLEKSKSIYETKSRHQLADFNLYYKIDVTDLSEVESIVNQLNRLDIVEIAYAQPKPEPAGDIDPPTLDYDSLQDYRDPAPNGVDAIYANSQPGGDGSGVKIIDIENAWNDGHEDLETALGGNIGGYTDQLGHHGTAVLGEMIGGDNGYGVTGICPGASVGMASTAVYGMTEALWIAIDTLEAGDLMLIEVHAPGPRYDFQIRSDQLGYICMEYWQDIFDALQYAWAKGIIVIEAAGNGAEDLDDVIYEQRFDTTYRNSHAIIAGAGAPPSGNYGTPRSRLGFSNHGERVNLQGYGREVFTTGYGSYWDGDGDPDQYYTSTFSGTSSASPIVTGAVACLQGYYENTYGVPMDADRARQVLYTTGTAQQGDTTEHIGPLPNLAAAMAAIIPPPSLSTDPIYFDTTLVQGTTSNVDLWLHNGSGSYALDFAINDNDSLPKIENWLEVAPASGTVPLSDSVLLSVTFDASLLEDQIDIYKGIIEISWNVSGQSLDSLSLVPVFLEVPCMDDTTFLVSISNDISGPEYNWIELYGGLGTAIPREYYYNNYSGVPLDDGSAGPIELPFTFPFYGGNYDELYVGVNGGISFTDVDVNASGYFGNVPIPGNSFSTFVSVFWNDLMLEDFLGNPIGDIYYYHSPTDDTTIIEWYHVGNYNAPSDTMTTFEAIFTADGNITLQYQYKGTTALEHTAVVGLSEIGCTAEPFVDQGYPPENVPDNSLAVLFERNNILVMSGDCNNDGTINIFDITHLISYLYLDGPPPDPEISGDVNCDETINIFDITYLIQYLYLDGPSPCYYRP